MSIAVQQGHLQVYLNPWVSVATLPPNTWCHVAVAKDSHEVRIYVNGAKVFTGADTHLGIQESPLVLGASDFRYFEGPTGEAVFADYFDGSIAQAHVWSGALSDAEVLEDYNADAALYFPQPPTSSVLKLVDLKAALATGSGPYPIPGAGSPWTDLAGAANNATLLNFDGTATSGWQGGGSACDPYRLVFDGVNDAVSIPAGSVAELQTASAQTAEMWFQMAATENQYEYLLEWLLGRGSSNGMSLSVLNGQLQVYQARNLFWVPVATLTPGTWYHVAAVKTPGELRIYLNGTRVYTSIFPVYGAQITEITLGASNFRGPGVFGEYLHGAIAQAAIFQGALSDGQVAADYAADQALYAPSASFTINASAGPNGSISPSGAVAVACGASQTFTITPDACAQIADVVVDGVSRGPVGSYSFAGVAANHTITASFALTGYTITASAGANGSIAPSGAVAVACGASQSFTITPNACAQIADVVVDGVSRGPVASYAFTSVAANHTITASFSL
jgi:hypothetical protein